MSRRRSQFTQRPVGDDGVNEIGLEGHISITSDIHIQLKREEVNSLKEQNSRKKEDRKMRKLYAEKAYSFALYTIALWAFLFLVYFLSPSDKKPLKMTPH